MSHSNQLSAAAEALRFTLAGKATLTLVSTKTGTRYTYLVKKGKKAGQPHFVSVLRGADNEGDFTYLGVIFDGERFRVTAKSQFNSLSPCAKAFSYFINAITGSAEGLPALLEVWHKGACGQCGKPLTVPESIACGYGPKCAKDQGVKWTKPGAKTRTAPRAKPVVTVPAGQPAPGETAKERAERLQWQQEREMRVAQGLPAEPEPKTIEQQCAETRAAYGYSSEAEMRQAEAEADRAQTARDEAAKAKAREALETEPPAPEPEGQVIMTMVEYLQGAK